jgi:hypothetical protein
VKESRKHESWVDERGTHLAPDVVRHMAAEGKKREAGMATEDPAASPKTTRRVSDAAARRSQVRLNTTQN